MLICSRIRCIARANTVLLAICALGALLFGTAIASAQDLDAQEPAFENNDTFQALLPLMDGPTATLPDLDLPRLSSYAPADRATPLTGIETGELFLDARLTDDGTPLDKGMVWRIFGSKAGTDGQLPLIATARGGSARFELEPGSYLVHAAFGRASASARVDIGVETRQKSVVLNAGALKLDAMLPDGSDIRRPKLRFDIFDKSEESERTLILPDVKPGQLVPLPAGMYHVVSKYGGINAKIRADLRVEAGKLTQASIEHRAALVTLNLVRSENGFPLADTAWSVVGPSGDVIAEQVSAYPTMVLAAGEYTVVAHNRDRLWQQSIKVQPGRDVTFRLIADPATATPAR